ncbi:MAG: phosphohistidine phosphatase SixA [Synoicihabitans sp.]
MRLFLIRHAHALDHENDAKRPISERGQLMTQKAAQFLKSSRVLNPRQIWHSPLQRAFETAADLVSMMELDSDLVETDGLLPFDDPQIIAERLRIYPTTHDIAMVGHQPHLSRLASLLINDSADPAVFHFKKNAVLALRMAVETHPRSNLPKWRVAWHFSPEFLPEFETLGSAD